jgi:hypothetical protein
MPAIGDCFVAEPAGTFKGKDQGVAGIDDEHRDVRSECTL